ncbi:MAG: DUF1659 domain-containing protein [Peptoclostridium sp.]|uniref:DUF1659 domain-containing protein n=1 Tax=Peptoclostridium sp. TaxID=1904860 RepID=UPI00139D3251|nr:DUF1659 domain-containing protein [Peptoclostridium sp.]MZQ75651.1 DUF1659 domain-containing protein [Peptoclostridium sp.]
MANVEKVASNLQLTYSMGIGNDGKEVFKRKTFKNFRPEALDADILAVASGLASVQEPELSEVKRIDESVITA